MSARIWELHARTLGGHIRSTPEGEADIDGLVLTEKAYLLAVRDFRPQQLVELVRREGATGAAETLVAHYAAPGCIHENGGRQLVTKRGFAPHPVVRRNDEPEHAPAERLTHAV